MHLPSNGFLFFILMVDLQKPSSMRAEKPTIPKGTRDFGPETMSKKQHIFDTIKGVFKKFGFEALETPAMENLSVLMGKYGVEGDQLLFKVLNSGDFLAKAELVDFEEGSKALTGKIASKGLRYDLTVPFARYVVMNQHAISFPFKRYQIQPVWRADRPQKGRYREFYQCDADVIGTKSLVCEAEMVLMINEVLDNLGIPQFAIRLNHRKLLVAMAELVDAQGQEGVLCTALDKLDKIGRKNVETELKQNGLSGNAIQKLDPFFQLSGSNLVQFAALEQLFANSETGMQGLNEIKQTLNYLQDFGLDNHHINLDITLARGLSYYTGIILEVVAQNTSINGSIAGGGRYDNLTGVFGLPNMSGVGFSFGVERIFDVMEDLEVFPTKHSSAAQLMLISFDDDSLKKCLGLLTSFRVADIPCEVYPTSDKIKKQMAYADKKGIPYVLLVGEQEIGKGLYQLKNMLTGEQKELSLEEIIEALRA
jgi:histidyl-tRNA synthetase